MEKYLMNEEEQKDIETLRRLIITWDNEKLVQEYKNMSVAYESDLEDEMDICYYAEMADVYKNEILSRMNAIQVPYYVFDERDNRVILEGSHEQCATYMEALYESNSENFPFVWMKKRE